MGSAARSNAFVEKDPFRARLGARHYGRTTDWRTAQDRYACAVFIAIALGLAAAAVIFHTVRSVRAREYGELRRYLAFVTVLFGGFGLVMIVPFEWAGLVFVAMVLYFVTDLALRVRRETAAR
ncbi:hypothetical protein DVA67_034385 [Solirubrobacter sp. CPCC 204708]|nr:hypothetical protein [Solirubrobacter deserti]